VENIHVPIVAEFTADSRYDLVIVVMRKNSALKILPLLSQNEYIPHFLFLMNNAAGAEVFTDALGAERVMMGFPGMAGYIEENCVTYITAEAEQPAGIVIGAVEGQPSDQVQEIGCILEQGQFINITIEPNMDAWSKYHVALLFPALAPALYLCGNDHLRLARTRDALVLAWRGIQEAFSVLRKLGYPVRPVYLKRYLWLPEPIAVALLKRISKNPRMDVGMARHARSIRDEIEQLNAEFRELIARSGEFTPVINFLMQQFSQQAPSLPDGTHSLRLRWSELLMPLLLVCLAGLIVMYVI
jgi:2-dehydropantoate 2-reductase